eukprot:CAMPEP_0201660616 /NCGR_PEP_ID=MMETSP0494-20130426/3233_1 /ASSEMBLY_ACC=CAM_ASM_000839 /TAXON_ID=420259 /ORGANISM="Thalassiosira gravida, Strain GMp14c1" /LENGTH=43 /DNA_ID= /DNA_START= /DNA_END= /DNA_ORIENTATION=
MALSHTPPGELVVISWDERGIDAASCASLMIRTWSPAKEAMES